MEELTQREKLLFDRLPLAAMQLRTALGGIYFGARRLATPEERENDPELDRNAAVLYRSYYQLLRLAKDLESVELLGREEPLPRENLDLLVWLDEIIRECQVPFELKGVTLELLCSERYVITAVNKRWLEQAVWHLLSNALAACGKGGRVTVTLLAQRAHVLIKVTDNGRGIPPEQQDMLRTWHLRPVTPEYLTGGLGIGLPVVHQVMKLHGGHRPGHRDDRRPDAAGQQGGRRHHRNAGAAGGADIRRAPRANHRVPRRLPAGAGGAGGRTAGGGVSHQAA